MALACLPKKGELWEALCWVTGIQLDGMGGCHGNESLGKSVRCYLNPINEGNEGHPKCGVAPFPELNPGLNKKGRL